jgi:hypothetical protein
MSLNHQTDTLQKTWMNLGPENVVVYNSFSLNNPPPSSFTPGTPLVLSNDGIHLVLQPGSYLSSNFGSVFYNDSAVTYSGAAGTQNVSVGGAAGSTLNNMSVDPTGLKNNNAYAITVHYDLNIGFAGTSSDQIAVQAGVNGVVQIGSQNTTMNGNYQVVSVSGICNLPSNGILQLLIALPAGSVSVYTWTVIAHRL